MSQAIQKQAPMLSTQAQFLLFRFLFGLSLSYFLAVQLPLESFPRAYSALLAALTIVSCLVAFGVGGRILSGLLLCGVVFLTIKSVIPLSIGALVLLIVVLFFGSLRLWLWDRSLLLVPVAVYVGLIPSLLSFGWWVVVLIGVPPLLSILPERVFRYAYFLWIGCSVVFFFCGVTEALFLLVAQALAFSPRLIEPRLDEKPPIVFFDGVCVLCNSATDVLMGVDWAKRLRFAPLQGTTAKELLPEQYWKGELKSMVLFAQGRVFEKSTGILEISAYLGGVWALGRVGLLIPRFARDWIYDCVANTRYSIFGKRDSCRLPTAGERSLFLE